MEPRCAPRGDLARAAGTLDEADQSRRRRAPLVDRGPSHIGHPWQRGGAELPAELGGHRSPAVKHRALGALARCASPSVPVEPLEIESSRAESENPALDGACDDADALRDARHRSSAGHFGDGIQNDLDPRDLARKRIERQHALAVPAIAAAPQRDRERQEFIASLEPPLDPTARESEIASVARSTTTRGEDVITRTVDDRGVAARLDLEYEDHVLTTASGKDLPGPSGAVTFSAHLTTPRMPPPLSVEEGPLAALR